MEIVKSPGKRPKFAVIKNVTNSTISNDAPSLLVDKHLSTQRADMNDNAGAAVFLYKDEETGISQKFALSLRYYFAANDSKPNERIDGLYEFSVNGSQHN